MSETKNKEDDQQEQMPLGEKLAGALEQATDDPEFADALRKALSKKES